MDIVGVTLGVMELVTEMVGVFDAVDPKESDAVGVCVGVGVDVELGVGVLVGDNPEVTEGVADGVEDGAAASEKLFEFSVYGVTPVPGLWILICAEKLLPNPGIVVVDGHI
jgi:hypothetical protein